MLLSIKPRFVQHILDGSKRFEYRKVRSKRNVSHIIIYSTSPVMKVVAEARVKEVLVDDPETIWKLTNAYSGVSKEFFDQYYLGKDVAVAYELDDIEEYPASLDLKDFGVSTAPQSFIYLDDAVRCSLQHNPVSLH